MNATPGSGFRIGDAEREAAVNALGEHFAAGRLSREEYDERADRALAARTTADVTPLFTDLPAPHPHAPSAGSTWSTPRPSYRPAPARRGPRFPMLPVLLAVIGVAVLLKAPWLVFLVLGALWFSRSRHHGGRCSGVTSSAARRENG